MLETDRTTTLDPQARLAVLLATTGLTQLDLAKLLEEHMVFGESSVQGNQSSAV